MNTFLIFIDPPLMSIINRKRIATPEHAFMATDVFCVDCAPMIHGVPWYSIVLHGTTWKQPTWTCEYICGSGLETDQSKLSEYKIDETGFRKKTFRYSTLYFRYLPQIMIYHCTLSSNNYILI